MGMEDLDEKKCQHNKMPMHFATNSIADQLIHGQTLPECQWNQHAQMPAVINQFIAGVFDTTTETKKAHCIFTSVTLMQ